MANEYVWELADVPAAGQKLKKRLRSLELGPTTLVGAAPGSISLTRVCDRDSPIIQRQAIDPQPRAMTFALDEAGGGAARTAPVLKAENATISAYHVSNDPATGEMIELISVSFTGLRHLYSS